jgi:hypothetical protein
MTAGKYPGAELCGAVVTPVHPAQIAGTAGLSGNLRITLTKVLQSLCFASVRGNRANPSVQRSKPFCDRTL